MGDDRFFTPLRYVQNDMWVAALRSGWHEGHGKEGWVPASARTTEREGRFPEPVSETGWCLMVGTLGWPGRLKSEAQE